MKEHEEYEEKVYDFKRYVKQTLDLMVDAYRWKEMSKECDNENMKMKYKNISDTLMNMFMEEHENMRKIFQEDKNMI